MRALIQRVTKAEVRIDNKVTGKIDRGYLILIGIGTDDTNDDVQWLAKKIYSLRLFDDEEGKMNLDLKQVQGDVLVVSQFTLHAKTKKGARPSYIKAARPQQAIPLYEQFCQELEKISGREVATGEFGGDMKVELINDGPVTIWIDTKQKE